MILSWVEICFPPSTGTLTTHSTETNHGGPSGNDTCLGHYWEPHKRATNLWTGQQLMRFLAEAHSLIHSHLFIYE